jgi:hypothetical protein
MHKTSRFKHIEKTDEQATILQALLSMYRSAPLLRTTSLSRGVDLTAGGHRAGEGARGAAGAGEERRRAPGEYSEAEPHNF